jgi:hypothetical protein
MVTVRYFKSATDKKFESHFVDNLKSFLKQKDFSRDELLDLRFFKGDVLGEEINTINGHFLSISEGEIEVLHGSTIPQGPLIPFLPYIFAALAFVAAIALTPKISLPNEGNRKQGSSTNRLGSSTNEPNINGRIDDIFGYVAKHTPPIWQVPYRIGINNQETEVLLVAVGRGKYDIDTNKIYDGYTPYVNIPNSQINIYEPGTYPGNGSPSQTVGGNINEEIGIYRESNDLNASELLPPNDLALGRDALWFVVDSGSNATITLLNAAILDIDLRDYFVIGQDLQLIDTYSSDEISSRTLYRQDGTDPVSKIFNDVSLTDLSGQYEITDVTSEYVNITGVAWGGVSSALVIDYYSIFSVSDDGFISTTLDGDIMAYTWYETYESGTDTYSDEVYSVSFSKNPDVGQVFDNTIGPITIFEGAERIIINMTSASGFYKIDGTTHKPISANVEFVVEELDIVGDPTGISFTTQVTYSSNPGNVTSSVYQTAYINIPYSRARVYGRRTTNRDKNAGISNVDKIEWTLLYSFESNPPGIDFGDVTLMHCVVPSNSQSRLIKQRKTNLDLTRKITQYLGNGNFGPSESYPTDDFSQILIHTALDEKCGRLNTSQINMDNIISLKDQINSYFGDIEMVRFGYDFDTSEMSYEDMFITICNVANCIPYVQNGVYDAFFEKEQTSSSLQITCRNKISESETREDIFFKKYDGVELSYRNKETGVTDTIYIPADRTALNPDRQEFPGCTTELQAYRRALRMRNKQIYHVVNVEFDMDEFGRVIVPGQRIDSPDGTRFVRHAGNTDGYRIYDGEVVEVNALVVELSEPVFFNEGEDHYIQFTNANGDNSELILCTKGDSEFEIILDSAPNESIYDGYDRDKTKYTFCSEQLRESIALIPQTIEFKLDSGQEINTISSINYDSRYYKDDMETI